MSSGAAIAVWTLIACSGPTPESSRPPPSLEEARDFYAGLPRYMRPLPHAQTPAGLPDVRAQTCGACHQEIYDEWRRSTHAHAWEGDPQFLAELEKSSQPDDDVGWLCVNCHTPVENQLPRLVARLEDGDLNRPVYVDNPAFDPVLQKEAISCATCHVREGTIIGPYGDSERAPHPVQRDPALQENGTCTQCHQAQAHFPELSLACVFNTGEEWARSPYAEQQVTCQSCHMPEAHRPIVPGGPVRQTRRHWFGGSLIPKTVDDVEEIRPLQEAYPHGVTVQPVQAPDSVHPGQETTVTVTLINDQAGHYVPSGDPERFLLISLTAALDDGTTIAETQERIGSVYQWYPDVKLLSDNRMAPLEQRTISLQFSIPQHNTSQPTHTQSQNITVRMKAEKWRISTENLEYHHLEDTVVPNITFNQQTITIPIRNP